MMPQVENLSVTKQWGHSFLSYEEPSHIFFRLKIPTFKRNPAAAPLVLTDFPGIPELLWKTGFVALKIR
jgi:hypothetical protein